METDETYAVGLLRQLDREPQAPSTVDIRRAIADGRRHQRRARLTAVTAAVGVFGLLLAGGWAFAGQADRHAPVVGATHSAPSPTAAPMVPNPPSSCTQVRLPVPAGQARNGTVTAGDPTGRYLVGRSYPGWTATPLLIWHDGAVQTVAMPGEAQTFQDITSTGLAVGTSVFRRGSRYVKTAWVYQDGKLTRLAGDEAAASAVNEHGVIVGSVHGRPALWRTPSSKPTQLALPGGAWQGSATGIDEDGTVVGRLFIAGNGFGYVWGPDGSVRRLPAPKIGGTPASSFSADAIRGGWVVGVADRAVDGEGPTAVARWNLRTGGVEVLSSIDWASDVNRSGWLVAGGGGGPVLLAGGRVIPLPDGTGAPDGIVNTVSDDGSVLGGDVFLKDGAPVAVAWHCR